MGCDKGGKRKMTDKTLLQQIREKELLLNIKIEDTRRDAEEIILKARRDAEAMIENSESEGKAAAQHYYEDEMEAIKKEIDQLTTRGNQEAISVKETGERNLQPAIKMIVETVSME
jgi:vacuolar-type H+-ATPase subunit H